MAKYIQGATYFIYCLIDPTTSNVFYVGATPRSLSQRFKEHLKESTQKAAAHRSKNIGFKKLMDNGITPMIELLEEAKDPWNAEAWWVYQYKFVLNMPILNEKPNCFYHFRSLMAMSDAIRAKQLLKQKKKCQ